MTSSADVLLAAPVAASRWQRMRAPVGSALAGLGAAVVLLLAAQQQWWLPPCPIKYLTGCACPGCGGTRMFYALLEGDVPAALHWNAVTFALIPLMAWAYAAWVLGRWRGRPVKSWLQWKWTPYLAVAVFATWSIIRNLPFPPFQYLYV